jgi:hypothetical protein
MDLRGVAAGKLRTRNFAWQHVSAGNAGLGVRVLIQGLI